MTASDLHLDITTDLRRSMRRVRIALLLFGLPCAWSLTGLYFRSTLPALVPRLPEILEVSAGLTMVGVIIAILVGWTATRDALRQQDLVLRNRTNQLALTRRKLETLKLQRASELRLQDQKLKYSVAIREARRRIDDLKQAPLPNSPGHQGTESAPEPSSHGWQEPPGSPASPQRAFHDSPVTGTKPPSDFRKDQ